jgi:hypothetical protein
MSPRVTVAALAAFGLAMSLAASASAQTAPGAAQVPAQPPAGEQLPTVTVCGQQVAPPAAQPPAGSGPVVLFIAPCFEAQGNQSVVESPTYLYYIQVNRALRPEACGCPSTTRPRR